MRGILGWLAMFLGLSRPDPLPNLDRARLVPEPEPDLVPRTADRQRAPDLVHLRMQYLVPGGLPRARRLRRRSPGKLVKLADRAVNRQV